MQAGLFQEETTSMTPSKYQEEIYHNIQHGSGDGLVSALAGSGKTHSLVEASKSITRGTISRHTANEMLVKCPSSALGWLRRRLQWHYERITSITEIECETMCVTVPDGERFLQNGFDGWNSKGLENERIFILRPELMPHPMAKRPYEQIAESNLKYVALTRSRSDLYFIETPEKPKRGKSDAQNPLGVD
jgi:hypothetical protein